MSALCSLGMLLGRVLLSIGFILAGIEKFMDYDGTAAYMASKGMTMIPLFLYAAAIVELLGGLSLLIGYKIRYSAAILILFLIPVTLIFHNFWALEGADRQEQMYNFLKNLGIMGGLFYVLCAGAGKFGFDCCSRCHDVSKT